MKLITFTGENSKKLNDGHPNIGVNQKTGVFNINKIAIEKLDLKDDSQLIIHQDEEDPENWYLEIVKEEGFNVRVGKEGSSYFNSVSMARTIADAMSIEGSFKIKIATEPVKYEDRTLWACIIQSRN